ncbi:cysteine desulfurase/sulfurtransferase TusA family protein [Actinospica robiniae]|uniref:cysteine desulfurase/sulfurtransferase TusA family protein n=1 Tax=Actinospica robiniae TaxID=304901 RepID=UPI0003F56CE2|nr:cysteine desulfurase/sulfurtransferase TusA family protein [Actinospica robiniae]
MVYLDAAGAEPLDPAGREAYLAALDEGWAGPDRLYREGRRARMLLDAAREAVAQEFGCRADELVFTSSGTTAVHQGVLGLARGRMRAGTTIAVGAVEHSSVLHAVDVATRRSGGRSVIVPVDGLGRVSLGALADLVDAEAGLAFAAIQSANHEVGTRQPVTQAAGLLAERGVPLLMDAAVTLGREPVPEGWAVLAGSARKWGGPTGVGVLAVRKGTRFAADWPEDERERGWAPGPVNVPAILAAATALRTRLGEAAATAERHRELTALLRARIPELVPNVEVVGDPDDRAPHILTFSCLYASGEALLLELDRLGFAVSSGSSCTASTLTPSHVLEAMGVLTQGNVRVSLPWRVTADEVEQFLAVLPGAVRVARPQQDAEAGSAPAGEDEAVAEPELEIDALGKLCPLPVIELGKRIGQVQVGGTVRVLADDPAARLDIPAWCRLTGHDYLGAAAFEGEHGIEAVPGAMAYRVRRRE